MGIAAQADSLAQVIHVRQVVFPFLIKHIQHQGFFKMPHDIHAGHRFFLSEMFVHGLDDPVMQHFLVDIFILGQPFGDRQIDAELTS